MADITPPGLKVQDSEGRYHLRVIGDEPQTGRPQRKLLNIVCTRGRKYLMTAGRRNDECLAKELVGSAGLEPATSCL